MKKIYLFLAALLCGMTLNAKTIYLNTGGSELWNQANAVFFVHAWDAVEEDLQMSLVSGDVYSVNINDGNNHIIFLREQPGSTSVIWDESAGLWNRTADLEIPSGKDCFTITGWSFGDWSVYGEGPGPGPGPGPQPSDAYWYWKGNVDGDNIENEAGGFNIFQGGLSSISVGEAAYIFVMYQVHGVQGEQYMTDGWQGTDVTHVTLSSCGECPTGDKLYIPAGDHTLYLYDNGDGTVELSRVELPGKTLVGGGEQGIEHTTITNKAYKRVVNGQLLIYRGDKVFDATGRQL